MMKKASRHVLPALLVICLLSFVLLHVHDLRAQIKVEYKTFTPAVTAVSGSSPILPHGVSDINNRINIAYLLSTTALYSVTANSPGTSFASPRQVRAARGYDARITVDNALNAYVIYSHRRSEDSRWYPHARRSVAGQSYSDVFRGHNYSPFYEGASKDSILTDIVSLGRRVYIVAEEYWTAEVKWRLTFFRSEDWGSTFEYIAHVGGEVIGAPDARFPSLAASEDNVYVAFLKDDRLHFSYNHASGDLGDWTTNESHWPQAGVDSYRPGIAAAEDRVFLAWSRGGNIWFDFSDDGGQSFSGPERLGTDTTSTQTQPSIGTDASGDRLYVSWVDRREGGSPRIYFQEGIRAGAGYVWGVDDDDSGAITGGEIGKSIRVSDTASGNEERPSTAVGPDNVYVVWRDDSAGIRAARYTSAEKDPDPVPGSPAAPTNLAAAPGDSVVALTWTASVSPDVSYYRIYRSQERGGWTRGSGWWRTDITGTAHTGGAANGTLYWYVATAVDTQGNESVFSNAVNATAHPPGADTEAPEAPQNLRAVPGDRIVNLNWDPNDEDDLDRYHVYVRTSAGAHYSYVDSVAAPATLYNHRNLTNAVTYEYVVTAIDTSNNESDDSESAHATPGTGEYGTGPPPAPAPPGSGPAPVGPGGGCFIAAAAYGGGMSEEVRALSAFRDACLSTNAAGRIVIRVYYGFSPPLAEIVSGNRFIRALVRAHLAPAAGAARLLFGRPGGF